MIAGRAHLLDLQLWWHPHLSSAQGRSKVMNARFAGILRSIMLAQLHTHQMLATTTLTSPVDKVPACACPTDDINAVETLKPMLL